MDSYVQIVSHVCTVCAEIQLAAASSTHRVRPCTGGEASHTKGKVAQSHTQGKGGGPRLRGETPHPRQRWRKATPMGEVGDLD